MFPSWMRLENKLESFENVGVSIANPKNSTIKKCRGRRPRRPENKLLDIRLRDDKDAVLYTHFD